MIKNRIMKALFPLITTLIKVEFSIKLLLHSEFNCSECAFFICVYHITYSRGYDSVKNKRAIVCSFILCLLTHV